MAEDTGNGEIGFEIVEYGGRLEPRHDNGWALEVNLVAWNGGAPKIDIRSWDAEHERMTRGITLTEDQAKRLGQMLHSRYRDRHMPEPEKNAEAR